MRDYLRCPAQTNLELYEQLNNSNYYSIKDIQLLDEVYFFVLPKTNGFYRGSGKPFIAHLVGTCSILAAINSSIDLLIAGLLHAIYQTRVGLLDDINFESRRNDVINQFGKHIDDMILQYNEYKKTIC